MPRIRDEILECAVYLYRSIDEALKGENAGGSGFLVGVPMERSDSYYHTFAVTAGHVVRESGCRVVRLNTLDGGVDAIPIEPEDWVHHPAGDDLTVCFLSADDAVHRAACIPTSLFITEENIREYGIGPGDEVFMVGRFLGHDGRQQNLPTVRFGNISRMHGEKIRHPRRGIQQESFLVEARSLSGYSGSPVFVYVPPFSQRPGKDAIGAFSVGPALLGIDWCHLHSKEPVREKGEDGPPVEEGWWVKTNSGMMGVIPVWKLVELLDTPEVKTMVEEEEKRIREEVERGGVTLDAESTMTKEEYENALRRVARRQSSRVAHKPTDGHPRD